MNIKLTDFAMKHFERKSHGTKILNVTSEDFEKRIQSLLADVDLSASSKNIPHAGGVYVHDGYAPFCKLVAVPNFTDARVGSVPITESNYQYLRSGYSSRKRDELKVLTRWLELPLGKPKADWLMIVLYDKNQIDTEARKDYSVDQDPHKKMYYFDADWGIITILGQSHSNEEPMTPMTAIRNAYMHGGSGAPIDESYYKRSVDFWQTNAIVK